MVENATNCFSLSIWADESAIPHFGTSHDEHIEGARTVFGRLKFHNQRPEVSRPSRRTWWSCGASALPLAREPATERIRGASLAATPR
jgi:hypothetical protein